MERRRAIVSGRVQGVGFRYSARAEAERLGLAGFVRNLSDGTVETEYEGPPDRLAEYERWLASGPPSASVASVVVDARTPAGADGFDVR